MSKRLLSKHQSSLFSKKLLKILRFLNQMKQSMFYTKMAKIEIRTRLAFRKRISREGLEKLRAIPRTKTSTNTKATYRMCRSYRVLRRDKKQIDSRKINFSIHRKIYFIKFMLRPVLSLRSNLRCLQFQ